MGPVAQERTEQLVQVSSVQNCSEMIMKKTCINLKTILYSCPLPLPTPGILRMIHLQTAAAGRGRMAKSNVAHHALRGT